jgi:hypothetical protein
MDIAAPLVMFRSLRRGDRGRYHGFRGRRSLGDGLDMAVFDVRAKGVDPEHVETPLIVVQSNMFFRPPMRSTAILTPVKCGCADATSPEITPQAASCAEVLRICVRTSGWADLLVFFQRVAQTSDCQSVLFFCHGCGVLVPFAQDLISDGFAVVRMMNDCVSDCWIVKDTGHFFFQMSSTKRRPFLQQGDLS